MNTCSVPGCERPHYSRTWCRAHYKRWAATGDVRPDEPLGRYSPEANRRNAERLTGMVRGPYSAEHRAAISAAKKGRSNGITGRPVSPETRAKLSAASSGKSNGQWKAESVGYVALHERARKVMEKSCQHCGATDRLDAALRKDAEGPLRTEVMRVAGKDRTLTYSTNVADYMALCRPCHKKYDTTP